MVVLVTGSRGQLGQSFQWISSQFPEINFNFYGSDELDITNENQVKSIFDKLKPDFCINCAAYTAVDKAEADQEKAFLINVKGSENLAIASKYNNTTLIHVSTDFVFDGSNTNPYLEIETTNPLGVYGKTKLDGEDIIKQTWEKHIIIRTSWVYSQFGNNFLKTMLRLGSEKTEISVVEDQVGTPTYAVDLAFAIIKIIKSPVFGTYNFSNLGICSWYEFALKIFELTNNSIKVNPIPSTQYPTPAVRPKYSVMDKSKIMETFNLEIYNWEISLEKAISNLA